MGWINDLLHNAYFIWCVMSFVIFGLTQLIKLPIKYFTNKIQVERVRRIVNTVILLIPFAFGILFEFLWATFYLHEAFSVLTGLGYGTTAISLYGIIERFFKVKIPNPYDSEEGESVSELAEEIAKDGKVDESDIPAVQEFLDKLKK